MCETKTAANFLFLVRIANNCFRRTRKPIFTEIHLMEEDLEIDEALENY